MKTLRFAVLFAVLAALSSALAHAQPSWPSSFVFSLPVPCGEERVDTLRMVEPNGESWTVLGVSLRTMAEITFTSPVSLPQSVPAGEPFMLPLRFRPARRGASVDSAIFYLRTASGRYDTVAVRITGQGIGSEPAVSTTVLNFPRTATGGSSMRQLTVYNVGELPLVIDPTTFPVLLPYRITTGMPVVIAPGDSAVIDIVFEPSATGYFTSTARLGGSCGTGFTMEFNGVTDLVGTGAVLRLTHAAFNSLNPEQNPCGATRCGDLTIRNVGNAPLMIDSMVWMHNTGYSVTSSLVYPFFIEPNHDTTVQVCVTSMKRGYTRDTLIVGSNNRRSIAFGLVIDASGSMKDSMDCGAVRYSRIAQAKVQAKDFIAKTLLYIPPLNIQDQLVVCSYTDIVPPIGSGPRYNYIRFPIPLTSFTDPVRVVAQDSIDKIEVITGTPTGAALLEMIDTLKKSPLQNRVIVLLTDGEALDKDTHPAVTIAAAARAAGVRIFTIGIDLNYPEARTYLGDLGYGSGGEMFVVTDCNSLQDAFSSITDIVSRGAKDYEPFELLVTAPELVSNDTLQFDSLMLGTQQCRVLTLTNVGEGVATLDSVQLLNLLGEAAGEFTIDPAATGITFPVTIPERMQTQIQICFVPDSIRVRRSDGVGSYFNCSGAPLRFVVQGVGVAAANLRIQDMSSVLKALPGDIITMPVYADSNLRPYDVDRIDFGISWNKTMLDLQSVAPGPGVGNVSITAPVAFGQHDATAGMTVVGAPKIVGGGEVLAQLQFQVLRGDSLGTSVDLVHGHFADGNPLALLSGNGRLVFDSTCFRDSKPIFFADPAAKVTVGAPGPQPVRSGETLHLPVSSNAPSWVGLALFAADGTLALDPQVVDLSKGERTLDLPLSNLPTGAYYLMVRLPSGVSELRSVVVAR